MQKGHLLKILVKPFKTYNRKLMCACVFVLFLFVCLFFVCCCCFFLFFVVVLGLFSLGVGGESILNIFGSMTIFIDNFLV